MNTIRNTLFFALLLLLGCANANEKNKENKTAVAPSPVKPYHIRLPEGKAVDNPCVIMVVKFN